MNRRIVILATFSLLVMAFAVSAQVKKSNFSGDWRLDIEKSELGERSRIESMTMKVIQSETELSVDRKIKRKGNDGSIGGALGGGNRGRGRQRLRADLPSVKYDLSGKETTTEMADGIITGKTKFKAKFEGEKLTLTQNRTLNTPRGERKTKTVETWELSDNGNTLTVLSDTETRRGNRSSKQVFTKTPLTIKGDYDTTTSGLRINVPTKLAKDSNTNTPKRIMVGVINGKALNLVSPEYPTDAREQGVSGAVNVSVVIGKDGKIIEAKAISGHDLLRDVCVEAAKQSTFAPTYLSGQAVEVSGVIVYNFRK